MAQDFLHSTLSNSSNPHSEVRIICRLVINSRNTLEAVKDLEIKTVHRSSNRRSDFIVLIFLGDCFRGYSLLTSLRGLMSNSFIHSYVHKRVLALIGAVRCGQLKVADYCLTGSIF